MSSITITPMTRELCHLFYRDYKSDPMAAPRGVEYKKYVYSKDGVDNYFDKQNELNHMLFAVMLDDVVIGEAKLYNFRSKKPECSLTVSLKNNMYKGLGFGTKAIQMVTQYAKDNLNIQILHARITLGNHRAKHIAKKLGFIEDTRDIQCIYYDKDLVHEFVKQPIQMVKATLDLRKQYYAAIAQRDGMDDDMEWLEDTHDLQTAIGQLIYMIMIDAKPIGEIRIYSTCSIINDEERDVYMIDIGIADKKYLNRGYGTEALTRTLAFIQKNLERKTVRLDIDVTDAKSQHICEKVGFTKIMKNYGVFIYEIEL